MGLPAATHPQATAEEILSVEQTSCCIVGGGPAGAMLALLLARRGVPVTLLEMHKDFDREFRGDTVHPSTMEILDQIGLAGRLHEIPHTKMSGPTLQFADGPFRPFDLGRLKTKFPYILIVPQVRFLELIAGEAAKYSSFKLVMHANVNQLVQENGGSAPMKAQALLDLPIASYEPDDCPLCREGSAAIKPGSRFVRSSP